MTTAMPEKMPPESSKQHPELPKRLPPDVTTVCIVGPPGAGKGTQCEMLARLFSYITHISIGQIMRDEMNRPDSPFAQQIRQAQESGALGSIEVSFGVLRKTLFELVAQGEKVVLLDGQ
jgi:UMP-CMP kinase